MMAHFSFFLFFFVLFDNTSLEVELLFLFVVRFYSFVMVSQIEIELEAPFLLFSFFNDEKIENLLKLKQINIENANISVKRERDNKMVSHNCT